MYCKKSQTINVDWFLCRYKVEEPKNYSNLCARIFFFILVSVWRLFVYGFCWIFSKVSTLHLAIEGKLLWLTQTTGLSDFCIHKNRKSILVDSILFWTNWVSNLLPVTFVHSAFNSLYHKKYQNNLQIFI